MPVSVYEGERTLVKDNHHLGRFDMSGIPPAAKGVAKVEVLFEIDENSILTVTATEKGTGKAKSINITNDKGRLTPEQIEKMVQDAEKFADEDKAIKERIDAKHSLSNYIHTMQMTIDDKERLADKIDEDDKEIIRDALHDAEKWLNANDEASREDFDDQMKELQSVCDPIIAKIYQGMGGQGGGFDDDDDEEFADL